MSHRARTGARTLAITLVALAAGCLSAPNFSETLDIAFDPMYSGYDGVHTFRVPVTIPDLTVTSVKWSASDSSLVDLQPDPNGVDLMITTKKAGSVIITGTTATAIGKARLTITAFTPDQWSAGQTRYTAGSVVTIGMGTHGDGGYVACTSCHSNAKGAPAVEHTPEQTAGFTDDEVKHIFMNGQLPAADLHVPLYGGAEQFMKFHQWKVASDGEATGLIAYLRSLAPMSQGPIDFGGHGHHHHGDGGVPSDGGAAARDL